MFLYEYRHKNELMMCFYISVIYFIDKIQFQKRCHTGIKY
jgi:hypothetical protein